MGDSVGNSMAAASSMGTFTVLSGSTSSAADGYYGGSFAAAVAGSTNATADTTAPTFVSMYPPAGATDVPTSNITATMIFSEPVKFNASGFISIVNSSSKVVASVNLTKDVDVISTVYNGAKLDLAKVSLWFSEDITALSGSVTIKLGGTSLAMGVTSSNVTISGSAMDLTVFPGKLNSAGTWNVLVPA